jgi:hypothetical protein
VGAPYSGAVGTVLARLVGKECADRSVQPFTAMRTRSLPTGARKPPKRASTSTVARGS